MEKFVLDGREFVELFSCSAQIDLKDVNVAPDDNATYPSCFSSQSLPVLLKPNQVESELSRE